MKRALERNPICIMLKTRLRIKLIAIETKPNSPNWNARWRLGEKIALFVQIDCILTFDEKFDSTLIFSIFQEQSSMLYRQIQSWQMFWWSYSFAQLSQLFVDTRTIFTGKMRTIRKKLSDNCNYDKERIHHRNDQS